MSSLPKRKHPRLKAYDYGQNGYYFVTIQTAQNHPILSEVIVGRGLAPAEYTGAATAGVCLTPLGKIAEQQLLELAHRYPEVSIEKYVVMPTHIHVIIQITEKAGASPRPTLIDVVGAYKSLTTRLCNQHDSVSGRRIFQASFYEHVIRNRESYREIWAYIDGNPGRWREKECN